jgi:hypothetical protein
MGRNKPRQRLHAHDLDDAPVERVPRPDRIVTDWHDAEDLAIQILGHGNYRLVQLGEPDTTHDDQQLHFLLGSDRHG